MLIILPLLCRVAVHRPVRDAVRRIVVPEGDKPLIFTLREFSGQVIMVTLRPPVKAALFSQPVHRVIPERGLAAVLVGQHGDAPGSVIPHAARQTALRGADGFTPRIILCLTAATVRGNDSGEVACGTVLITGLPPLRILLTDQLPTRVITAVSADAFLPVNGDLLTVPVVLIPRRVPRAVRKTGMQMMRVADSRWPESLQQQQASTQWNEALKTRAQSSPQLRGWLQTRQDLHAFADLVMQREKEGLTLSYIKNVIWQAERGLGQETPVESLLTQYHDARAQKQNTDALEKQINERLEGVLSRWLLLKNNVMPEAATGTTAEK